MNSDYEMMKRWMDVTVSIIMYIIFSPLFVIIPILIKITSKGPVFYRQLRLGKDGRPFVFLKFRSMYNNSDHSIHKKYIEDYMNGNGNNGGIYKINHDKRITPLGKILRKASIDELPQLWNVLRGDMSIVGPRPPIYYEYNMKKEIQKKRLKVKPGITGLWQIRGRSKVQFYDMIKMDLRYIRASSIIFDILIMFETVHIIFSGKGAY